MKKILFVAPLMVISLIGCNKGGGDKPETFTVTFNTNGRGKLGDNANPNITDINRGTLFYDIAEFTTKQIAIPDDPAHFTFFGWGLTNDTQTKIGDTYKVTDNIEVFAVYKPQATAKVTFDGSSKNCKLGYVDGDKVIECALNNSIFVPAGIDIDLILSPRNVDEKTYLPVFKNNLTVTGVDEYEVEFGTNNTQITLNIDADDECIIKGKTEKFSPGPESTLDDYDWDTIEYISNSGGADVMFDVGNTKEVTLKGQNFPHTVRIIDFNHDDLADGSGKAGITFEFENVITQNNKEEAYRLNWGAENNYDYRQSFINIFLNDETDGATSVINMLPDDLSKEGIIKPVKKLVGVNETETVGKDNYSATLFEEGKCPKLFSLAYDEFHTPEAEPTYVTPGEAGDPALGGGIYEYYNGHSGDTDVDNAYRIKYIVGGSGDVGEFYWLRSPDIDYISSTTGQCICGWYVSALGKTTHGVHIDNNNAVAPAFCI